VLCALTIAAVDTLGSPDLARGLSVLRGGQVDAVDPASLAMLPPGLLTAAGPRPHRRTVAWSWNLVWVSLAIILITDRSHCRAPPSPC